LALDACASREPTQKKNDDEPTTTVDAEPVPVAQPSLANEAPSVPQDAPPHSKIDSASQPSTLSPAFSLTVAPREILRDAPRVYALTRNVWIREEPNGKSTWIGFLWFGGSVKVRQLNPIAGIGCEEAWYPIEPRGYVCVDDFRATLNPDNEVLQGIAPYAPNPESPWPHEHYGQSRDAQRYDALPTLEEQRQREGDLRAQMQRLSRAQRGDVDPILLGVDLAPATPRLFEFPRFPKTLQIDRDRLIPNSTLAWTAETFHEGRSWLLTADLTWVPKDRVIPYPRVSFRGVELGKDANFPLAFFRSEDRPEYRRSDAGLIGPSGRVFQRLSWVELSGNEVIEADRTFLETKNGTFVAADDAVVPNLREKTPWGDPVLGERSDSSGERQTWIDASILGGWLIAYESTRPVFVTLISPGRGGPPVGKKDPLSTASTPTGKFRINGKFLTATMSSPEDLVHSDVPWAQNFSGPHAIHAAYWHDRWGEQKSGGCLNVSPIDGKWLYEFTEPAVPEGWYGVRWLPRISASTVLLIHD
jgi:hypothetical protein